MTQSAEVLKISLRASYRSSPILSRLINTLFPLLKDVQHYVLSSRIIISYKERTAYQLSPICV